MFGALTSLFYYVVLLVGLLHTVYFLYRLLDVLLLKRLGGSNLTKYKLKDSWVIITGATDGIGLQFANQLAQKGFNIFLVSRTQSKLDQVGQDIESKYKVKTANFALDFSKSDTAPFEALDRSLDKLSGPVTILINNVGQTHDLPERFLETPPQVVRDICTLNITSTNEMTRVVLPRMLKQKNGLVVNLSTGATVISMPLLGVYAASKSYVNVLTEVLQTEYGNQGVDFEVLAPFFIETKLSKVKKAFTVPTPEVYVKSAISTLGKKLGAPHSGFLIHDVIRLIATCLPVSLVLGQSLKANEGARRAILRRREREAKEKKN